MAVRTIFVFSVILLLTISFIPSLVFGAEIPHSFVSQTTQQTHTGDTSWTDIPGTTITSGNFTAGRDYLVVASSQMTGNNANGNFGIRAVHGSTPFTESDYVIEPFATTTKQNYFWFTVWEAVASEQVKLQYQTASDSVHTVEADQISLAIIELSVDLTENTDWFFSEDTNTTSLTTTWSSSNNASTTFTPGTASEDWLILTSSTQNPISTSRNTESRLSISGGTSDTVTVSIEGEDTTNDNYVMTVAKVYTLPASSHTITQQSQSTIGNQGERTRSAVFLMNLDKFNDNAFSHTKSGISIDTTDDFSTSTETQTTTLSTSQTGDVFMISYGIMDSTTDSALLAQLRQQVDNSDDIGTQTSDGYDQQRGWDGRDLMPWAMMSVSSLSSGSHTVDMDVTSRVTNQEQTERTTAMFSMELGSGGPPPDPNEDIQQNVGCCLISFDSILDDYMQYAVAQSAKIKPFENDRFKVVANVEFENTKAINVLIDEWETGSLPLISDLVSSDLGKDFTNPKTSQKIHVTQIGPMSYEIYPKISYDIRTPFDDETTKMKLDTITDKLISVMDSEIVNSGGTVTSWHIHKSFGSIDIVQPPKTISKDMGDQ